MLAMYNSSPRTRPHCPKADEVVGNTDNLGAGGIWAEVCAIGTV